MGLADWRGLRESFGLGRPIAQREAHTLFVLMNARSPGASELSSFSSGFTESCRLVMPVSSITSLEVLRKSHTAVVVSGMIRVERILSRQASSWLG